MNCCGLNAERRGNLHVTEGMDYRDAWGWIGIGSSGRRHEGFHSIISIDNCEGCVKHGKGKASRNQNPKSIRRNLEESIMDPRRRKKAAMQRKLQQLRSVTNSSAVNKASIIVDATRYIEELKQKVDGLNSELGTAESSISQDELPMVTVETLERGFLINVFSERNCPGMLVAILDAFEELGLDVLDARVSCEDTFQLEAVGGESQENESIDAQVVKQAVMQAIQNMD
ncbi:hypothetical protein VNO80_01138 [Phaseolus coccineus]|uniref:Plant bHLH transcription factor ACT-like domain-containing protein n=1 Tax=Phaseolus coccineus TaxID=3886 RepID=A0AAN9P3G1_PHACN